MSMSAVNDKSVLVFMNGSNKDVEINLTDI